MKPILSNASNQYHILRHFSAVSDDYQKTLLGHECILLNQGTAEFERVTITQELIGQALQTTGSKFFSNITNLENPKQVLDFIITKTQDNFSPEWKETSFGKFYSFLIKYPQTIGYKNLIKIDELTNSERQKIRKETRGSHQSESVVHINVVEGIKLKELDTIEVGIYDSPELDFLYITAYPGYGLKTLDFPNSRQTEEEKLASTKFWDSYVFVR